MRGGLSTTTGGAGALRNARARAGSFVRRRPGVAGAIAGGAAALAVVGLARNMSSITHTDPFKNRTLSFPNDYEMFGNHIEFRAYATNGLLGGTISSIFGGAFSNNLVGTDGAAIRLPLPNNLKVDYDPQYTSADLGSTAIAQGLKAADRQVYGNNTIDPGNAAKAAGIAASGQLAAGLARAAGGGALAQAAGAGGNDAAAALKVGAGLALNPHKIVLFTGVEFRTHQFSWRLSPRNKAESDAIDEICRAFTYYSHPSFEGGGLFLKYPEFFAISFKRDAYLFKFMPCVLDSISIDYQPMGYAAYKRSDYNQNDPAPAEVQLSLTFKETEIVTKDSLQMPGSTGRGATGPSRIIPPANQTQPTPTVGRVPGTDIPTDTFFGAP